MGARHRAARLGLFIRAAPSPSKFPQNSLTLWACFSGYEPSESEQATLLEPSTSTLHCRTLCPALPLRNSETQSSLTLSRSLALVKTAALPRCFVFARGEVLRKWSSRTTETPNSCCCGFFFFFFFAFLARVVPLVSLLLVVFGASSRMEEEGGRSDLGKANRNGNTMKRLTRLSLLERVWKIRVQRRELNTTESSNHCEGDPAPCFSAAAERSG